MEITKEELKNINGGAVSFGVIAGIGAGLMFIIGLVDGFVRPLKCRK